MARNNQSKIRDEANFCQQFLDCFLEQPLTEEEIEAITYNKEFCDFDEEDK